MGLVKVWIEAMRVRTLPVSVSGVLCAFAYVVMSDVRAWLPGLLCLLFAVLAQISSNFANEYYDYKRGIDRVGRDGPRRGVTEGDIKPSVMKMATYMILALACAVGCSLIYWGGLWLVCVGMFIAVGVLAYSTGPYPLSHHGLGEVAVVFFFGIVPVNMTYYIMCGCVEMPVFVASVAIGLMGANVLIVNNYRDYEDDKAVGKRTLCVILGRTAMLWLYLINGVVAVALMYATWLKFDTVVLLIPTIYMTVHLVLVKLLKEKSGDKLNPLLGITAMLMFVYTVGLLCVSIINS
ncbi:MAG: 1,4-dihydroxy-2-naphthoate octaprenyltransferase [Muribaculaceae bacterium]|nr:1,4-dihydroxy-2-naphthoate octaprenyltransferase [Muribaculaceae bacterium]